MFQGLMNPAQKMSNDLMPRPTASGVIGPSRMKMPEKGGDPQLRAKPGYMRSSLGPKLKPLPSFPTHPSRPESGGLIQSLSPTSGLAGIRPK